MPLIDVWNVETFDEELVNPLQGHADLIHDYFVTSRRQWLERELSDHTAACPENPFGSAYIGFVEAIGLAMNTRIIRAWHYTRLTDDELTLLREDGIYLSTLETIRRRFDAQVAAGTFTPEVADALFAASPFQSEQCASRSDKFWMTSHPVEIEDGGVELLLKHWGGESAYFWLRDQRLIDLVAGIGTPRILEIAVPLNATPHAYSAGEAVAATFARTLGCKSDKKAFDLYAERPLGREAVLAVHSAGDASFAAMARGFPPLYFDPTIGDFDTLMEEKEEMRRRL